MIVFSRDEPWVERLRRLAARGGWPFESRDGLPRSARGEFSENVLVILDRELAARSPSGVVKGLRGLHPSAAVVLACGDSELGADAMAAALSSGADETVVKSWADDRLLARLSAARDRAFSAAVRVSDDGGLKAERRSHRVFARARGRWTEIALPAAEFALLWRLMSAGGEEVSRERLLDELGAGRREVEAATISRRMLSLRRALSPWKGKVETVRGGCYRLVPPASSRRRSTT